MIFNEIVTDETKERARVLEYLQRKQFKSVIDIGGAGKPWANEYVTAYLDMNADWRLKGKTDAVLFNENISDIEGWLRVFQHVDKNGPFDFAICTQTLEDIRNPPIVLRELPLITKGGYIDVPSKYHELRYGCERPDEKEMRNRGMTSHIMGYSGHRWIMNMVDRVLELYPKLPFIEHLEGLHQWNVVPGDALCFWWKESIPFKIVGDDFLGPNPPAIYRMYREGLAKGL